jgi:hypothetical protein
LIERLLLALAGLFLVFPSLLEAVIESVIGRDIDYTATFGLLIAAAVLLRVCPETSVRITKFSEHEPD